MQHIAFDPDLTELMAAWPSLTATQHSAILAIVREALTRA